MASNTQEHLTVTTPENIRDIDASSTSSDDDANAIHSLSPRLSTNNSPDTSTLQRTIASKNRSPGVDNKHQDANEKTRNYRFLSPKYNYSSHSPASAFQQQNLPGWRPIIDAVTVVPIFLFIGFLFIPIGSGILYVSSQVKDILIDYTYCNSTNPSHAGKTCAQVIGNDKNATCNCTIEMNLTSDFPAPVYMYYELQNFYQNHRRYVSSRDDYQLLGQFSQEVSSDCHQFSYYTDSKGNKMAIVPCGAIANSLFSDEINLYSKNISGLVPLIRTGIAWPSDKEVKFQNPPGILKEKLQGYAKPLDWKKQLWELDLEDENNNGLQNEDLIVWMRTAAFPNFRKLYRKINHTLPFFNSSLPKGEYNLTIVYNYPVVAFKGRKLVYITTVSFIGGKNQVTGYAYLGVGGITLLLSIYFLIIHFKYKKRNEEDMRKLDSDMSPPHSA